MEDGTARPRAGDVLEEIISNENCVHVLRADSGPREFALNNVPSEEWGFSLIDGVSCQLNATNYPGPPAELVAEIDLSGQNVFDSDVMVDSPLGYGVTFGVSLYDLAGGRLITDASVDVAAGKRQRLAFPTETLHTPCRVTLWTRMAPGSLTHHQVRSYWIDPRFHGELTEEVVTGVADVVVGTRPGSSPAETVDPWADHVSPALERGAGAEARTYVPVLWSAAHRDNLGRISRNEIASRTPVDPPLADALLLCAEGNFAEGEWKIRDLLKRNIDICREGGETFISFLGALFTVQSFDLVAALLRARYGYGRELEIDVQPGGPGRARVRWDILPSGNHRFVFDAKAFEADQTHNEILLFQWEFPLFAAYSRLQEQEIGSVFINQGDVGQTPGLAYCDSRPDYFLIPDYIFMPSKGYRYARKILRDNRIAWQDRMPVAFWRGATTGVPASPNDWRSLERIKLCELAQRHADTGLIDAGISSIAQFKDPGIVGEIQDSGLLRDPVPWQDWGRFKYQIDIDGNSSPWSNLFQKLLTGNPVLKVESSRGMRQWFYDELVPWRNYVPVAPDMSDLMSKISWLARNDTAARRIGEAGLALAETLTYEREVERSAAVISAAFRYFGGQSEGSAPYGRPPAEPVNPLAAPALSRAQDREISPSKNLANGSTGMVGVGDNVRPDLGGNLHYGDTHTTNPVLWRYLVDRYALRSVLDVGCGEGHAVSFFHRLGVFAHGIEGLKRNVDRAVVPVALHDILSGPYYMPVDLVWSCEVAEHILPEKVDHYLDTLANGNIVAMTHALPGQDGHHHVNCQPPEYWIERMNTRRYQLATDYMHFREVAKREYSGNYFAASGLVFVRL